MPWLTLTAADLKNVMSGPEYNRVTTAALNDGQTAAEIIAEEIANHTESVRGYVGVKNQLGPAGTIPGELKTAALHLLRIVVFTRLPGLSSLITKPREDEAKAATRKLEQVAAGKFAITPPEELAADQPGNKAKLKLLSAPKRQLNRENMSRIL
jgi:hypothetical protein